MVSPIRHLFRSRSRISERIAGEPLEIGAQTIRPVVRVSGWRGAGGDEEQAQHLRETILSLCRDQGFYEYYDPTTGFGHGSDLFSWTAALCLDVVLEDRTSENSPSTHSGE